VRVSCPARFWMSPKSITSQKPPAFESPLLLSGTLLRLEMDVSSISVGTQIQRELVNKTSRNVC
jgi:hypothetical protein